MWVGLSAANTQADTEGKPGSAFVETFANSPFGQDAEKGAIALEYACTSPDMDGARRSLAVWPCEHILRSDSFHRSLSIL